MQRPKQIIDKFQTHVIDDVNSDGDGGNHDDQDDDDDGDDDDKSDDDSENEDDDDDEDDASDDDDDIKWRKESDSCRSGTTTQLNLGIKTKFTL